MRTVKPEVRILGIDDAAFDFADETTELVGVVFRGGREMDGVLMDEITVDGFDVTETVLSMATESRHKDQIQVILLDGITFGGFNTVDMQSIAAESDMGVIAVSRNEPDTTSIENGLQHVSQPEKRLELIRRAGDAKQRTTDQSTIYFQHTGIDEDQAREVLDTVTDRSLIPEPVRAAHMIAGALKNGESKSRV
jgi:endonuclease V-like protein UPF0215 family